MIRNWPGSSVRIWEGLNIKQEYANIAGGHGQAFPFHTTLSSAEQCNVIHTYIVKYTYHQIQNIYFESYQMNPAKENV